MNRALVTRLGRLEPQSTTGRIISIAVRDSHVEEDRQRCYYFIATYAAPVDERRDTVVFITRYQAREGEEQPASMARVYQPKPPEGWLPIE